MADVLAFNIFIFDSLSQDICIVVGSKAGEGVLEPFGMSSLGVHGAFMATWLVKPAALSLARAGRRP